MPAQPARLSSTAVPGAARIDKPAGRGVRQAATVVVLREGAGGRPELLLLRRHRRSGFAADAWVFPGGVVDADDRTLASDRWRGIDPAALAERFRADPQDVLGFHVGAARETFEESGLLLASHRDGRDAGVVVAAVRRAREALAERTAHAGAFAQWLRAERLVLDLDRLTYLSRWVTPTAEPRRYDACFFLAPAPPGQVAAIDRVETTDQRWTTPAAALDEHRAGRLLLMYPTVRTLADLTAHDTVDGAIAAASAQPAVRSVLPHAEVDATGRVTRIVHPDEPEYPHARYETVP